MSSPLIYMAFKINQICNNILPIPYIISWNYHQQILEFSTPTKNLLLYPYYFITFSLLGIITVPLSYGLLFQLVIKTDRLHLHEIILSLVLCLNIQLSMLYDIVLLKHGENLVNYLNWIFSMEQKDSIVNSKRRSSNESIFSFRELSRCNDTFGMALISMVLSYFVAASLVPWVMVGTQTDIFYLWSKIFGFNHQCGSPVYILLRIIAYAVGCQLVFMNLRTFTLCAVCVGWMTIWLLKRIRSMKLNPWNLSSVTRYKEFYIAWTSVQDFTALVSQFYLAVTFFVLVIGINSVVLGWRKGYFYAAILAAVITGTTMRVLVFSFEKALSIVKINEEVIPGWKAQLIWGNNEQQATWKSYLVKCGYSLKYAYGIAQSCKSANIKVAGLSMKIDKEYRLSYINGVLVYVVNFLVSLKDFK